MARTKSAEVWALWRDRLRRYLSSDLTVAAFCDWEGVSQAAFYVWRKKLPADSGLRSRTCNQSTIKENQSTIHPIDGNASGR